jgi:hypothetical protein
MPLAAFCVEPPLAELPPVPVEASFVLSLLQPEIESNETAIVANIHLFVMTISQRLFALLYRLPVSISPRNV